MDQVTAREGTIWVIMDGTDRNVQDRLLSVTVQFHICLDTKAIFSSPPFLEEWAGIIVTIQQRKSCQQPFFFRSQPSLLFYFLLLFLHSLLARYSPCFRPLSVFFFQYRLASGFLSGIGQLVREKKKTDRIEPLKKECGYFFYVPCPSGMCLNSDYYSSFNILTDNLEGRTKKEMQNKKR